MVDGVRIDELPPTMAPGLDFKFPVIRENVTTYFTVQQVSDLITAAILDSAPGALDTLNELAAAMGDDPNFATTVTNAIAAVQTALDAEILATNTDITTLGNTIQAISNAVNLATIAAKTTPVDADVTRIGDSAAAMASKKLTFANLKAWILAFITGDLVTPWVAYTPTFTGFGVVTGVAMFSRRVGDTLQLRGKFTSGTSTAVEARLSMGYKGVNITGLLADPAKVPAVQLAGTMAISLASDISTYILCEPSVNYVTFSYQDASDNGLTKRVGLSFGSGTTMSIKADIPIQGW